MRLDVATVANPLAHPQHRRNGLARHTPPRGAVRWGHMGKDRLPGDKPSRLKKSDVSITMMTLEDYCQYAALAGGAECPAVAYLERQILHLGVDYIYPYCHQQVLAVLAPMLRGKDDEKRILRIA